MSEIPPHIIGAVISTLIMAPLAYSAGLRIVSAIIALSTLVAMCLAQTEYFASAPYVFTIGLLTYILNLPKILKSKPASGPHKAEPNQDSN